MRRVFAVVITVVAAFGGWRYYSATYAPVKAYKAPSILSEGGGWVVARIKAGRREFLAEVIARFAAI